MAVYNFKNVKTISQLPSVSAVTDIGDNSYFCISLGQQVEDAAGDTSWRFSSRKISTGNLASFYQLKILEVLGRDFEFPYDEYLNALSNHTSTTDVFDFVSARAVYNCFLHDPDSSLSIPCNNRVYFKTTPKIEGSLTTFPSSVDEYAVNVRTARNMLYTMSPFFIGPNSLFFSKEMNVENSYEEEIHEAPTSESEKHNRYLFRMVGYHSVNVWKATESGIFTCWGWVDMQNDPYAGSNCNAWIALEGMIDGKWRILQLRPFDKNNGMQLSYVSFTFPVEKDLELRLTSGFRVGTNSNKYQSANGSLANHIANCFVGGIYKANVFEQNTSRSRDAAFETGEDPLATQSYVDKKIEEYSRTNLITEDKSSANQFDFHMDELDDSKKSTVAELKATINELIAKLNALSENKSKNI